MVRRRQAQRARTTASTGTSHAGRGDKVAYHWEGEPGDTRTITYAELLARRRASSPTRSKALGVEKGDRVNIYLGMVPELPMALLACAADRRRALGRVRRLLVRLARATASTTPRRKVLITGDGAWRRGSVVPLKETADVAVAGVPVDREGARAAAHRARRRR